MANLSAQRVRSKVRSAVRRREDQVEQEEIESGEVGPQTFTLKTIADRVESVGDLWAGMRKHRYSLRSKIKQVEAEATSEGLRP